MIPRGCSLRFSFSLKRHMPSEATVSHDTDSKTRIVCIGDPHFVREHSDSIRASHLQATGRGLFLTSLFFQKWRPGEIPFKQRYNGARRAIVLALEGLCIHLESMSAQILSYPGDVQLYSEILESLKSIGRAYPQSASWSVTIWKSGRRARWDFGDQWTIKNDCHWAENVEACLASPWLRMLPSQWYSSDVQLHWVIHLRVAKDRAPCHAPWLELLLWNLS